MAPVDQSILVPSQPTPKLLTLRLLSRLRLRAGRPAYAETLQE